MCGILKCVQCNVVLCVLSTVVLYVRIVPCTMDSADFVAKDLQCGDVNNVHCCVLFTECCLICIA